MDREVPSQERAMALARQGNWQQAEAACHRLLKIQSDRADTHSLLGVIYLRTGREALALESLRRSLALQSRQPLTQVLLGDALLNLAQTSAALSCFEAALEQDASLLPALFGKANALLDLQQFVAARTAFEVVLKHAPDYAEAWFNRGNCLMKLREWDLAVDSFERAIRLRTGYATAYNNRGTALVELQRLEPALASFDAAVVADPTLAAGHRNRGTVLDRLRRPQEALQAFERTLSLDSRDVVALRLQGDVFFSMQRHEEAAQSFVQLLRVAPDSPFTAGALHHAQRWSADWQSLDVSAEPESLRLAALAGRGVDHPFSFLAVTDDPEAQLRCARAFVENRAAPPVDLRPRNPYRHRRIRVAYVSGDFRTHAISYLLAGVLEKHDRRRFETIGISLRPPEPSPLGARMQAAFDRFIDVSTQTDLATAQLMRGLEVDIAVDLGGHTNPRPDILACRPAPVQVQHLGFPGTMGAPFMDYLLADSFVIPPAHAGYYSERVVYLPECFQANGNLRGQGAPTLSRREAGLPDDAFVFCSFNNIYKLNPTMFDVWMRLLRRVPGSVLWLFAPGQVAVENLRREAARRDVDPERLVFAARRPYGEHIGRLGLADLFLDTLPFNGGATASDALWCGVPLLTCSGRAFAARMAGSLLQTLGLQTLVTETLEAYESRAVSLAGQSQALPAIRRQLAEVRASAGVFDAERSCRQLERAYEGMWQRHERGEAPESFGVDHFPPATRR